MALKKPTIKNPELVSAMAEFKQKSNPETEKEMLRIAQTASFITPISLQKPIEEVEPDENGSRQLQASLMAVEGKNGNKMFPAFTDWLEFLKWKNDPDADTMVLSFDQYCDILLKQGVDIKGIVINPAEAGVVISKEYMAKVKGVTLPKPVAEGANAAIAGLFGTDKIANPALTAAADKLKQSPSQETQNAVFQALRTGRFVAPAIMHDLPKNVKPGDKVTAKAEFVMINQKTPDQGEQKLLPLFSSLAELQKWTGAPEKCCGVPLTLSQYSEMLANPNNTAAGVVIDPFSRGLAFRKEDILKLSPRMTPQELKVFPFDMAQELKAILADIPEVKSAYLTGVKVNNTDGHLILLDLTSQEKIKEINDLVVGPAKKYGAVVVAPVQSPIGKKAIEGKSPFYEA